MLPESLLGAYMHGAKIRHLEAFVIRKTGDKSDEKWILFISDVGA